jgi:DNA replication and repair protein RecF
MYISRLELCNLRSIRTLSILPSRSLNIVLGCNGSGKTSLLEGIYLLGRGRSFRTRHIGEAVCWGRERLAAFAETVTDVGARLTLGVERGGGVNRSRVAGEEVHAASRLAAALPLLLISPESQRLVVEAARYRRQLMDWTLFHVEHRYADAQQRYQRALRQRNAALQRGEGMDTLAAWQHELGEVGEQLHAYRRDYLALLLPLVGDTMAELGSPIVSFDYRPGWDTSCPLREVLAAVLPHDMLRGYTTVGPHRADLRLTYHGSVAQRVLSGGEMKRLVAAVLLAQVRCVSHYAGVVPVVLVDDLGAELDETGRRCFLRTLQDTGSQVFVTALSTAVLDLAKWPERSVFHVEQGTVKTGKIGISTV